MIKTILLCIVIIATAILLILWLKRKKYGRTAQYIVGILSAVGLFWNIYAGVMPNIENDTSQQIYNENGIANEGGVWIGGGLNRDIDITYNYYNYYDSKNEEHDRKSYESTIKGINEVDEWCVGWGDDSGGRKEYTIKEINEGRLEDKIIFNSIKDSVIGHEFNFVGAKNNDLSSTSTDEMWNGNVIEAEDGHTYRVRLYVHNNSPLGLEAIARDVSVNFIISDSVHVRSNDISLAGFDSNSGYFGVSVHGIINSSNAEPSCHWDGVKFVSNKPFKLQYVPGTALFENNAIGSSENGAFILSDDVITEKGVQLGYDEMNGNIPGCYQYAAYVSIVVMPVFYE